MCGTNLVFIYFKLGLIFWLFICQTRVGHCLSVISAAVEICCRTGSSLLGLPMRHEDRISVTTYVRFGGSGWVQNCNWRISVVASMMHMFAQSSAFLHLGKTLKELTFGKPNILFFKSSCAEKASKLKIQSSKSTQVTKYISFYFVCHS